MQEHGGQYPSFWAAIESIAPKIGCVPQTLLGWVQRHEVDTGVRDGVTTAEAQRVKEFERDVRKLRRANEILRLASAFLVQAELGRRLKFGGTSSTSIAAPMGSSERDSSLVHHSDRGSRYVGIRYSERLAEAGIEPSVAGQQGRQL